MDISPTTHTGAPKRKQEVCPDSQIPYAEFKESLTMDEVRERYPVADDTSTRAHQFDVELEIKYSIWISNPPTNRCTHGTRDGRNVKLWTKVVGPKKPITMVLAGSKSAMWDWKCVCTAILAKITERDPGVGHEARCNNLAGELDWTVIHLGPPLTPSPSGTMAATNLTWPLIIPSISDKAPGSSLTPLEDTSNLSQPGLSLIITKDVTKEVPELSSGTVHLNQRLARAHQIHPARGMNPMIEVTIMYTLYVPFGKDTRGQVYSQLWETSEPPCTIRLGLTELDFNGLKDKIWEHLSEENRIQRVDLVAKASDRADRLIWSFSIVEPNQRRMQGAIHHHEGSYANFALAAANSSSQAKVVIEVCMPQDYEVITPLPQETEWYYSRASHPVLPVLCGPSPSAPRPQAANPSPSAFRPNTPIGPLQAPVVDANGSPHATQPKKELLDLSIDGFLSYCRIPLKDMRVDQVIYDQQILHWTSFIGQTHNSLEALGFGWGVRDLILRGLKQVKKELNI
ncbi:hypothetical protein PtA15_7A32 [Puccinia triticina]|uniref:Uncharacterized protein n=1 Tax=Puccinia triticina TaxID=208348 RepID=A0ABY7CQ98_9BASI|nr:uncharacterized protein PtA15_7A32 [Puccinia triticina]WAQ86306.1 hypothetical protein PtA15_7A32 [Puccinia triticina]WAR56183.1 hypothetical protein PtB15_7B28 [Puccinia triticina]